MSLFTYSGIAAKVKAMKSKLLTDEQFLALASQEDVRSAADYLRQLPAYEQVLSGLDDTRLHRGYLEQLLAQSIYRDFAKLYRFSNLKQRKFLDLYFRQFETSMIKRVLRHMSEHHEHPVQLSLFRDFYFRHSSIDLASLTQAANVEELIQKLQGSPYYETLSQLQKHGTVTRFDVEMQLDLYILRSLWDMANKQFSRSDQKLLAECLGTRLDLLNLQWIYRGRQYYHLSPSQIYALLIPVHYRLRVHQIQKLTEASSPEAFTTVLKTTGYGSAVAYDSQNRPALEEAYQHILNRIYSNISRKNPYSIAILDSYLYFKQQERKRIVTTLEGIRYGLEASQIYALAGKQ